MSYDEYKKFAPNSSRWPKIAILIIVVAFIAGGAALFMAMPFRSKPAPTPPPTQDEMAPDGDLPADAEPGDETISPDLSAPEPSPAEAAPAQPAVPDADADTRPLPRPPRRTTPSPQNSYDYDEPLFSDDDEPMFQNPALPTQEELDQFHQRMGELQRDYSPDDSPGTPNDEQADVEQRQPQAPQPAQPLIEGKDYN